MGSLYKRKQKYCRACKRLAGPDCKAENHDIESRELATIWIKYYQNGRAIRESTGTTKDAVARRMLRSREGDVERGIPIVPQVGRITFEEAADNILNDYRTNGKHTLADVARRLDLHLRPVFRGRRLIGISTADVRSYIALRQQPVQTPKGVLPGAKNATINRELALLKRMFSLAVKDGRLHSKPHIPMLREDNVRTGFFERDQFAAVRAALPDALKPLVSFAYLTGWRVKSEILGLEWRQVDWAGRMVRLDPGKTKNGDGRSFPFTVELESLLRDQLAEHERLRKQGRIVPLVFHRDGNRIRDFRTMWERACTAAGAPGRILHDFRRTAVRNLERAGVPRSAAMAMVGHKTEAIYRRYAIVDSAVLREAAARIDRVSGTLAGTLPAAQHN